MKYNEITYKACQPAYKRASENAEKHGTPYGMVIITTPNNLDVPAGKFCKDIINSAAKWNLDCFDFDDNELDNFIENSSQNSFIHVEYSYIELGRDDNWLKEMIRQVNGDTATIKREILLDWPESNENSVFTEDQLMKVYEFIKKPVSRIYLLNNSFAIDFYEAIDIKLNYIISCDVAGGLSRDNTAISIIHPEDFRIVGDFRNNKIDTDNLKKLLIELMTIYFRNAILVIEKNSYGKVYAAHFN